MYRILSCSLVLIITIASLFFPYQAHSKTNEEDTGVYTLGEIVVSGEKIIGVESVGTVREITEEDIRIKNARTLDEALELLPGLDIRTGTDGVKRVDIRGLRSRHVLLLVDGIPFNSTFDGQFDPSIIPVENIARIKVSYGNHSVLYGQGGLAGVINVITKKGKKGVHGSARAELGEKDRHLEEVTLSGAKDKWDFFVSGSSFETDGYPLSDDFETTALESKELRENSDRKNKNLLANVGFAPNDKFLVGLVVNYLQGEYGKPPSTLSKADDPVFAKNPKYVRVEHIEGLSSQASFSAELPGPLDMRGWFFVNQLDEDENRYDDGNYNIISQNGSYTQDTRTEIYGGALQTGLDLQSLGRLTLGLNAEKQQFESKGSMVKSIKIGKKKLLVDEGFDNEWDVKIYSASMEHELFRFKPFGIVLGYGHSWFKKQSGGGENDSHFLVGAHYDFSKDLRIRGSFARKIRFPSIRQLYDVDGGNPDLTAERSYNSELGIEKRLPMDTNIALTLFRMDVADYIEKIPPTDQFLNNDRYRFQGIELTAETRFFKNLLLRGGYTLMYTEDRSSQSNRDELQYRPQHKFSLEGKYNFDNGFGIYMNVMYVADQSYYSETTPPLKKELNDYALVSVKIDKALFNDRLNLYLGADNLLDKDYEEAYCLPQAGRTIYGGAEIRF
jgi:outer membrane cobalamin receptor